MSEITKPIMLDETGKEVRDAILALSESFNGITGAAGKDGADGADGKDGTSVTVASVTESAEDGGSNVVTFSDGNTMTVKNGSKGSKGDTGETGATGNDGAAGADGFSPTVDLTETDEGVTITVTNKDGQQTANVKNGSGGGGSSWDDLTGKPFGEETDDILPEAEFTGFATDEGMTVWMLQNYELSAGTVSETLVVGETYTVMWDGAECTCTAVDVSSLMGGMPLGGVGNLELVGAGENTGEPFLIIAACGADFGESTDVVLCYTTDEGESHTIGIAGSTIKTLDAKFLPMDEIKESVDPAVTAVDLSNYESSGIIVETRADGSTVTYTMEFDADGNPTKITDSNGNETVLTW